MAGIELHAEPLTRERFEPFGDVVAAFAERKDNMNAARFERFHDLARIDVDGAATLSIARAKAATALPYRFDMVERHPLGSQAFMPLGTFCFLVVVGRAEQSVAGGDLSAFVTNGRQGVNYRRGVWHMPLIALQEGHEFLIVDRARDGSSNYEEHFLDEPVTLYLK